MAKEKQQRILDLARQSATSSEDIKLIEKEQFKLDGKYTFAYIISLESFANRLWMIIDEYKDKIKKRYSTRISTYKNALFSERPTESFYSNLLQNTAAEIWFEENFNIPIIRQRFRIKCMSHYTLNKMEHKWIQVGYRSDLIHVHENNKHDVPLTRENLIFITYIDQKFYFWGAVSKADYNAHAIYGKTDFRNSENIYLPTEFFHDEDFKNNPIVKKLKTNDELEPIKKEKRRKYRSGFSNIANEKRNDKSKKA